MDTGFMWSDEYRIDIEVIDNQHKELVDLFHRLCLALEQADKEINLDGLFMELARYANYHFQTEESFFKMYKYPATDAHIEEHRNFVQELLLLYHDSKGNHKMLPAQIHGFLQNWLKNHVFGIDQDFGKFLRTSNALP
jgi:hemerythrin